MAECCCPLATEWRRCWRVNNAFDGAHFFCGCWCFMCECVGLLCGCVRSERIALMDEDNLRWWRLVYDYIHAYMMRVWLFYRWNSLYYEYIEWWLLLIMLIYDCLTLVVCSVLEYCSIYFSTPSNKIICACARLAIDIGRNRLWIFNRNHRILYVVLSGCCGGVFIQLNCVSDTFSLLLSCAAASLLSTLANRLLCTYLCIDCSLGCCCAHTHTHIQFIELLTCCMFHYVVTVFWCLRFRKR